MNPLMGSTSDKPCIGKHLSFVLCIGWCKHSTIKWYQSKNQYTYVIVGPVSQYFEVFVVGFFMFLF